MGLFFAAEIRISTWLDSVIQTMPEIEIEGSQPQAMCSHLEEQLLVGERGCRL